MSTSFAAQLSDRMSQINEQLLTVLRDASDEQLRWSDRPTAPSIGFHIWHIARYADRNQAMLAAVAGASGGIELWQSEQIATRWGLDASKLGGIQTGMGMSDDDAAHLPLPPKTDLLSYAERALHLLDERFAELDDRTLAAEIADSNGRQTGVAATVLSHLTHSSRHLGMIEALRGMQGMRGTASA